MGVEVTKEMPEPVTGWLHSDGGGLTGVDGDGAGVQLVLPDVVSVPVHDVGVKAHVPDVLAEEVQALASMEGSILALRFMSGRPRCKPTKCRDRFIAAVAVSALFCDHVLTLGDEIELIWYNRLAKPGNRVAFILNRYLTEIMVCYVAHGEL